MTYLTKTFIQNLWFDRVGEDMGCFEQRAELEPSIDEQVEQWVQETGNVIVHPGQPGIHTTWHGTREDPYQLKCVTLGVTVLYQQGS